MIPAIKESCHFKQFIGIDEHFPEFCNDYDKGTHGLTPHTFYDKPQTIGGGTGAAPGTGFSFKIMSDLLGHGIKTNEPHIETRPTLNHDPNIEEI